MGFYGSEVRQKCTDFRQFAGLSKPPVDPYQSERHLDATLSADTTNR